MALDLLLINPASVNPNPMIPLGLASLAAVARESGYSVQVVDAWAERLNSAERLRARLPSLPVPRVVGISVLTPNLRGAREAVQVSRAVFPEALLVLGGPHVSAVLGKALQEFPEADLAVQGEGEITLGEILKSYLDSGRVPGGLPGTLWRESGQVLVGPPRPPIANLDTLPQPARDLFPLDAYHPHPPYGRRWRYMNEITSRGCPFHCAYCSKSVFGNSFRAFSPDRVVAGLRTLVERYQVREVHFYDDDLTLNRKRAVAIMERLIAAKLDLIWSCTTRCDLVDPELLRLMKAAGCWMISYGVESGNDAIRATVAKGVTREQIEAAFRATRQAGIKVTAYFMIGLPGETEATVQETMRFSDQLQPHYVNWAVMMVYPGSPFHAELQAGKYGPGRLLDRRQDVAASPFQDSQLFEFEGVLSHARMEELARQAVRRFYLRPANMIRIVTDIRSLGQLRITLQTVGHMLRWLCRPGATGDST